MKYNKKELFEDYQKKDNTSSTDNERLSMLFILANINELSQDIEKYYDFDKHIIKSESLEEHIPSSAKYMLKLAYNLFNSYYQADICKTFSKLNEKDFEIALKALRIRFSRHRENYIT